MGSGTEPTRSTRFNEAAGFTQRKHRRDDDVYNGTSGFNEAAGFTQRKPPSTR